MAKRTIHECDLTKQEFDPKEDVVFTLRLAKKGARSNMTYELSASGAEKLLGQLNGTKALEEDWIFSSGEQVSAFIDTTGGKRRIRTLEEASDEALTDEDLIAEKRASLRDEGILEEDEREADGPVGKALGAVQGKCRHLNKGRTQITMRKGKRFVFQKCTECRKDIPSATAEERRQYMQGKTPDGVNVEEKS